MCGTLKFENRAAKIGNLIPITNQQTQQHGKAVWGGFAKSEKLNGIWRRANPVDVHIDDCLSIVEKNIQLRIVGKIHAIGIRSDLSIFGTIVAKAKTVKIITRPAVTELEKKIHHRWPQVTDEENNVQYFTPEHVQCWDITKPDLFQGSI